MSEQGSAYSKYIEAELKAEYDRRTTLDVRAKDLTTQSSAFVGLVTAALALLVGKDFTFTEQGAWLAVGALLAFVVASLLALLASASRGFLVANEKTYGAMLSSHWKDDEVDARNQVATLQAGTIGSLRKGNNKKELLVAFALGCQVTGYFLLLIAAGVAVWQLLS